MGTDQTAIAFAKWVEAHKRYVEAQHKLDLARRVGSQMGGLPPDALVDEVKALKAEADRLLAVAEGELKRN